MDYIKDADFLYYKTRATAEQIARWLSDPTGTKAEWDANPEVV